VHGLGASFLLRRARSTWLLLACVAVTVLVTTGLAAALWTFAAGVVPSGALSALASPQGRSVALNGPIDASQAAADSRVIPATLRQAWPGVGFQLDSARWTGSIQLAAPVTATVTSTVRLASLQGFAAQATLTAGQWPGAPAKSGQVPMALPATVASSLHVTVGSVLTGAPQTGGATISMRVTGLFRPGNPESPYWALDLLPVSGISATSTPSGGGGPGVVAPGSTVSYGPAIVSPAAFGAALTVSEASWLVLPQAAPLASGNIDALAASTGAAVSQLSTILPNGLQVTSDLPQLLDGIVSSSVLTQSLFTIAALQLLLVAGAGLVLAARLLASLREGESALLRARGATRWQLARPALAEAVLLAAVAGLAGVLAGTRLTGAAARLAHLHGYAGRGIVPLAWLSALAMVLLGAAVLAWPALPALATDAAGRRRRPARLAGIALAGGDLALVGLAAVAAWQLHSYSAVAHPATGSLGIDPVIAVAPALTLAGTALIPLRGLPLLARLADKATDHERRLAAALVSWQIARRPIRQAGPALLVVVATATATLGLAGYASWRQSAADQAAFAVGADVRVDSGGGLSPAADGVISRAPGVTAATPASLVAVGGGQLIALDASTADKTIALRPDLSTLPASALWQRITPSRLSGSALPGQPARLEVSAALGAGPGSSAAEVSGDLGSVTVSAWIQDAGGATYRITAAEKLPADGRPHSLVFPLGSPRQASYPLRLLGLGVSYYLPPFTPGPSELTGRLSIDSMAVSGSAGGPFGRPFGLGTAPSAWQSTESATDVPVGPPDPDGGRPPADGTGPSVLGRQATAGGGQQLTFDTGHDPSPPIMMAYGTAIGGDTGQVGIVATAPSAFVPAIATAGYLAASRLGVGSAVAVSVNGVPVTVKIVASVARFPTIYGSNLALIADLAEVNDLLTADQAAPAPVTRWWLSTTDGQVPRLPAGLGLSVADRAGQQAALFDDSLLTAPRQAMLAVGVAAVLLGVLGFSISVAASLRARRTQSAVFAALGVGQTAQAGQLCLEQFAVSLPAAAAGLLAGIGLVQLLVPAITLTVGAAEPVPPVLVIVPLGPAVALALLTAAVPVAAAALSVLRRPDPAVRLREAG
jgi:ABC-type antimicrobial peptide transport system permease subunit